LHNCRNYITSGDIYILAHCVLWVIRLSSFLQHFASLHLFSPNAQFTSSRIIRIAFKLLSIVGSLRELPYGHTKLRVKYDCASFCGPKA
jgi:hypothetical protein